MLSDRVDRVCLVLKFCNTNICPNFVLFGRADSSSAATSDSNTRGEGLTEFGKVRECKKL
jgi:hypothetical protein